MLISSAVFASVESTAGTIFRKFLCFSIRCSPTRQPVSAWKLAMTALKFDGSSSTMCSVINSLRISLSKSTLLGKKSESRSSVSLSPAFALA